MQQTHVPAAGTRYWVALSLASVFGANTGDFIARYLHLGHAGGLPALAVLLALIFVFERRDRAVHQAYYWTAIIVVRTAATNLADLGASDFRLGRPGLTTALALLLAAVLVFTPPEKSGQASSRWPFGLPVTDSRYWFAMLIAGTLGTVVGDMASFGSGVGTAGASVIEGGILLALLLIGRTGPLASLWFYWLTVVAVRAAGTSFGDFLAHDVFGLAVSTLATGLVFVVALVAWKERPSAALRSNEAA
ncbi:MAG: hypothetical protein JO128_09860 [Alphaproteobacteria bacterium]|nr:hypothetical protein [Alphaproteobacteria bacterium]